jgi:hypothetical protein
MFEPAELGHKIDKAACVAEVPKLRVALFDAQLDLAQKAAFPVIIKFWFHLSKAVQKKQSEGVEKGPENALRKASTADMPWIKLAFHAYFLCIPFSFTSA